MKKLSKQILAIATFLTLLSGIAMPTVANAQGSSLTNPASEASIDLSLQKEEKMIDDVLANFATHPIAKTRSENTSYLPEVTQYSVNQGKEYVPEGAVCTALDVIGTAVYVEYELDNVSYTVAYFSDGTIEKTVRALDSNEIYSTDNIDHQIECVDVAENDVVTEISEEEADKRMNQMIEEQWPTGSEYPIEGLAQTRAASPKTVYPKKYTQDSNTKPYKGKLVLSGKVTISAFSGTQYSTSQPYKVYETMAYHVQLSKKTNQFAAGCSVAKLAKEFTVSTSTALGWLKIAGVAISTINKIKEACQVVDEQSYKFAGGKEVTIYDPTRNKKHVEVYSKWGDGKIALSWPYSGSYRVPTWGHTARSSALKTSNTTMRDEALRSVEAWGW